MTTQVCPPPNRLRAFYLGQLSDDQSDELVTHVSDCQVCQAELASDDYAEDSLIADLRQPNTDSELDGEKGCEIGTLRALGALAAVSETQLAGITSDGSPAALPKMIGEYEILRELGSGGMGHVYLAQHSKLGRQVAIKVLAGHRRADRRASQRFETEMRAIGQLSHPNIVIAHDARDIDGTSVLVTEFIDGMDLGQLLNRTGPLSIADACEIIRQVAMALQYTSDQGFVHRDVKPSNIMLSSTGEVKLLDLGLARVQMADSELAEVTGTGQTMGTADYISPEQVTDSRKVDSRSDIYSLGATLFKLLAGRAPFADDKHSTAFAKMTAHVSTTPANLSQLRSDVPIELARLVASMLAKRPEDRPQSPNSVAERLRAFAVGWDLRALAKLAAAANSVKRTAVSPDGHASAKKRTASFWQRSVKLPFAIAAGLVGFMVGTSLGIILTITNPDGSKTTMQLPDGSKVEVSQSGGSKALDASQLMTPSATNFAEEEFANAPLWFGLLETDPTRRDCRAVPLAPGIGPNSLYFDNGENTSIGLVSTNPKLSLLWRDIVGHITSASLDPTEDAILIEFDDEVGKKLREVSTAIVGKHLAIVIDGKIVATPRVNEPVGKSTKISGSFSKELVNRILASALLGKSTLAALPKPAVVIEPPLVLTQFQHDLNTAFQAFTSSLKMDRSVPINENTLDELAQSLAPLMQVRKDDQGLKDAIRKVWPLRCIRSMVPTIDADHAWLLGHSQSGYTFLLDRSLVLEDSKIILESLAGQSGIFEDILAGLRTDPNGPNLDIEEIFKHLGDRAFVCVGSLTPISTIAFSISAPEELEAAISKYKPGDHGMELRIVNDLLLVGNKSYIGDVTARALNQSTKLKVTPNASRSSNLTPQEALQKHRRDFNSAVRNFSSILISNPRTKDLAEDRVIALAAILAPLQNRPMPSLLDLDNDHKRYRQALSEYYSSLPESLKSAVRTVWPFPSIKRVAVGLPSDEEWLLSERQVGFTYSLDRALVLEDLRTFFDKVTAQLGNFDEMVQGLNDPKGACLDVGGILEHLGDQMYVCVGSWEQAGHEPSACMFAFAISNRAALELAIGKYKRQQDGMELRIVKDLLLVGDKEHIDSVVERALRR